MTRFVSKTWEFWLWLDGSLVHADSMVSELLCAIVWEAMQAKWLPTFHLNYLGYLKGWLTMVSLEMITKTAQLFSHFCWATSQLPSMSKRSLLLKAIRLSFRLNLQYSTLNELLITIFRLRFLTADYIFVWYFFQNGDLSLPVREVCDNLDNINFVQSLLKYFCAGSSLFVKNSKLWNF